MASEDRLHLSRKEQPWLTRIDDTLVAIPMVEITLCTIWTPSMEASTIKRTMAYSELELFQVVEPHAASEFPTG
jgi:hypothetical protein